MSMAAQIYDELNARYFLVIEEHKDLKVKFDKAQQEAAEIITALTKERDEARAKESTEVIYDLDDARKELAKLREALTQAGDLLQYSYSHLNAKHHDMVIKIIQFYNVLVVSDLIQASQPGFKQRCIDAGVQALAEREKP